MFIFSLSTATLAAEYTGTFDSFIVDTDYSDSTYVASSSARSSYLHTYPVNTDREWYSLYVTTSDPIAETCEIDLTFGSDPSSGTTTIRVNEVYKFVENDTVNYQYIGVSGFTNSGICRVAYSFENTNFETDNAADSISGDDDNETEDSTNEEDGDGSETIQCLDSDGGSDYNVQGTMTHEYSEISLGTGLDLESPITDYCLDETTLVEHFCADGLYGPDGQTFIHQYAKTCDNGCNEGVCLEEVEDANDEIEEALENAVDEVPAEEEEEEEEEEDSSNNIFSGIIEQVFSWFKGIFGNSDNDSSLPDSEFQETTEILVWQVDSELIDVLESEIIRAFDSGEFETDLSCPEGMLVSTMEVASEVYLTKQQIYGITLYCAPAGTDTVLDISSFSNVGWGTNLNNGGFDNEASRVVNGLRGFYTTAGPIEFIKKLDAQRHYVPQDSSEIVLEEYYNIWSEVPLATTLSTTANMEAFCSTHGEGTVTGISGLRVYTVERNNKDVVSGLQLRCTTLNQVNPVYS
ncbi:hypothetical protein CL619_03185 [archaeon]|nr:hypothetical protein [archaeon]